MIHLGDITKINGYEVPIVDCVIGGSPCQDLSIAGKRAGLAGDRSGLYIEQIRLIKEMREQYVREHRGSNVVVRPRYMVWENVPGAFSSNNGKDFAAVLEEAIRIAEPEAPDVPVPPKGWPTAGSIVGDGWSVAWRTHDAQYWGVPQRRKRISLVADFGGRTAPEILFECKSVSRNTEPSGEERKRPSEGTERSVRNSSGFDGNMGAKAGNIGYAQEQSPTLNAGKIMNVISFEPGIMSRDGGHCYENICGTLRANMGDNQSTVMCLNDQGGSVMGVSEDVEGALRAQEHGHQPIISQGINGEVAGTLDASYYKGCDERQGIEQEVVYCLQGNGIDRADTAGCNGKGWRIDQSYTLNTIDRPAVYDARGNGDGKTVCTITGDHENRVTDYTALCVTKPEPILLESNQNHATVQKQGICTTLPAAMGMGGGYIPMVMCLNQQGGADIQITEDKSGCLTAATNSSGNNKLMVMQTYQKVSGTLSPGAHAGSYNGQDAYNDMLITNCYTQGSFANYSEGCGTLRANGAVEDLKKTVAGCDFRNNKENGDLCGTLQAKPNGGFSYNCIHPVRINKTVRRLTPLECERLQGFPDNWTNIGEWTDSKGKKHECSDSARYKALGNSIALPFWRFLCKRISAQYARKATMASLFDGIGDFPLAWEEANGKGSAVWASEIDPFCVAVTKYHFGE